MKLTMLSIIDKKNKKIQSKFLLNNNRALLLKRGGGFSVQKIKTLFGLSSNTTHQYIKENKFFTLISTSDYKLLIMLQNNIIEVYNRDLTRKNQLLLKDGFYREVRKSLKLPARGQRTHTNRQTAKNIIYKN